MAEYIVTQINTLTQQTEVPITVEPGQEYPWKFDYINALIVWKLNQLIILNHNLCKQSGNQFHATINRISSFK